MLRLEGVSTGYGAAQVLREVSLEVAAGEIHCLMGRNGAGKTTLVKTVAGLLRPWSGGITVDGAPLASLPPHRVAQAGVGYIPQGRRLFGELTVAENLRIGLMARSSDAAVRDRVLALFPRLRERLDQRAATLSGGEQQMLATARALCTEPKVLLLDEPTEGLQPSMIAAIREVVLGLRGEGVAVLLVEQRLEAVLAMADRVSFLETGVLGETLDAASLRGRPEVARRYLGV
jgi:branched-chain amino acid transport system ATP-binding protein